MTAPRMSIAAGPPGGGKSSFFALSGFADRVFNADDRAAELNTVERHIERVMRRGTRGGHSASERTLRRIHASSLGNLPVALIPGRSGIDIVQIYDNSQSENQPSLVLEARHGRFVRIADGFPPWLQRALGWSERDLERHRGELKRA